MVAAELLCPKWTARGCRLPLTLHIRSVPRLRAERKENHEATSNGGESSYSGWQGSWRGDTTARARCTANEWPESVTKIVAALWRSLWHFVRARRGVGRYAATFLPGDKVPAVASSILRRVPPRTHRKTIRCAATSKFARPPNRFSEPRTAPIVLSDARLSRCKPGDGCARTLASELPSHESASLDVEVPLPTRDRLSLAPALLLSLYCFSFSYLLCSDIIPSD